MQLLSDPGVSLRSTPGYHLTALRAVWSYPGDVITLFAKYVTALPKGENVHYRCRE